MEFCVVAGRDGPERHHRPGVGAAAEQSHPSQQRLPGNLHCKRDTEDMKIQKKFEKREYVFFNS